MFSRFTAVCVASWALFVVACCCVPGDNAKKPKDSKESKDSKELDRPTIQTYGLLDLDEVSRDFLANKEAAQRKYKGKIVEVEGVVYSANANHSDGPFAVLSYPKPVLPVVSVWFDKSIMAEVAKLNKGDKIRVKGKVDSGLEFKGVVTFQLDECNIVSVVPKTEPEPSKVQIDAEIVRIEKIATDAIRPPQLQDTTLASVRKCVNAMVAKAVASRALSIATAARQDETIKRVVAELGSRLKSKADAENEAFRIVSTEKGDAISKAERDAKDEAVRQIPKIPNGTVTEQSQANGRRAALERKLTKEGKDKIEKLYAIPTFP